MNATGTITLAVALAAGISFVTTLALAPSLLPRETDTSATDELAHLRAELQGLNSQVSELRQAQSARGELRPAPNGGAGRLAVVDIEAEVARLFQERWDAALTEGTVSALTAASAAAPKRTSEEFHALLLEVGLDPEAWQAIWDQAREAGQLDALIALFEGRAEEFKNDPDVQHELGNAYLQKIFEVGDGPAAGLWAGKADASFDRALELDDQHWNARASKAIALSFWPPIFGKQQESIQNFEILVGQQERGPVQDRYSQTYLLLGNLYQQTGQSEKANAIWNQGSVLFPGDESLNQKLGRNQ